MTRDGESTWDEIHGWINAVFGPRHQLTDIRPTASDIEYFNRFARFYPEPGLHGHMRMKPNGCFENCARKIWEPGSAGLRYVQGLVASEIGIVYPHAWCTDATGHTIELTWDVEKYDGSRYFGVAFTLTELARLQHHFETYDWYEGFADILASRVG